MRIVLFIPTSRFPHELAKPQPLGYKNSTDQSCSAERTGMCKNEHCRGVSGMKLGTVRSGRCKIPHSGDFN